MVYPRESGLLEYEEEQASQSNVPPGEIVLGVLTDIDTEGGALVDYPGNDAGKALRAITTTPLTRRQINRQVAILFVEGDRSKPLIVGLIYQPLAALLDSFEEAQTVVAKHDHNVLKDDVAVATPPENILVDGERVVIEGKKEITLKCGDASITLTRAGKVLIKGEYVLTRSNGVNRIQGGSVQVN